MRRSIVLLIAGSFAVGCSSSTPTPPPAAGSGKAEEEKKHVHDHGNDNRANMLVGHAGPYHAWLTAHLSAKDGNELDVFIEDEDTEKPVALTTLKFTAKATRDGDDKTYDLVFEAAPADERPKDEKAGTCSHFVAKAPWMKPDDAIALSAEIPSDGRTLRPKWKKFIPSKYAHHHD